MLNLLCDPCYLGVVPKSFVISITAIPSLRVSFISYMNHDPFSTKTMLHLGNWTISPHNVTQLFAVSEWHYWRSYCCIPMHLLYSCTISKLVKFPSVMTIVGGSSFEINGFHSTFLADASGFRALHPCHNILFLVFCGLEILLNLCPCLWLLWCPGPLPYVSKAQCLFLTTHLLCTRYLLLMY